MRDVDPAWSITYDSYDADAERNRETVFALGNGVFVTRGAACIAVTDNHHYVGTYRAGCYERLESELNGVPESTDTLVNLPDWRRLRVRVDGGPWLDPEELEMLEYAHHLDMARGVSERRLLVRDGRGGRLQITEERLVSMATSELAAIRFAFTSLDRPVSVEIESALDAGVINDNVQRYADYERQHLTGTACRRMDDGTLLLETRTRRSNIRIALAQRTRCRTEGATEGNPEGTPHRATSGSVTQEPYAIAQVFRLDLEMGATAVIEKTVALCSSIDAGLADPAEQAVHALRAAAGYTQLRAAHEQAWSVLWQCVGVEAEDADLNRALRLHAFHILQTVSPHTVALDAGIPARGWHGEGYRGHVFWDELFVLPFLNYRFPELAREALLYRYRRLDAARAAAREAGYRGAMYPWRSASDGREVTPRQQKNLLTGRWMPDHTHLQRHIGAAIAYNIWQHFLITGDSGFLGDYGAEMMLEIARFWASIACASEDGKRFEIKGVIGPDEYHNTTPWREEPGLDNNAYTNLMAAWTLTCARRALDHLPQGRRVELVRLLGLSEEELARWEHMGRSMVVPLHDDGAIAQFEGFAQLPEFDASMLPPELADERHDWALNAIGKCADDFQITKQADALALFYLFCADDAIALVKQNGYAFDREALRRSADYYIARTAHGSSLSRVVYAGALAEVEPDRSWSYFLGGLSTDLHGLTGESVGEGIHLGAMGGTLDLLQRRYVGVQAEVDGLRIAPALPSQLKPVTLKLRFRGHLLELRAGQGTVRVKSCPSNREPTPILIASGCVQLAPGEEIAVSGAPGQECASPHAPHR